MEKKVLKERYQVQLDYYGRALTQLTGKKVKEKWIYSFGLRKAIQLSRNGIKLRKVHARAA